MYSINYVLNKNITRNLLQEVIAIKTIAWPYPCDSQLDWIKQNLSPIDIHALLYKDKSVVAYLNLIDTRIQINGNLFNAYGIGNVCAVQKHQGYGRILMEKINLFIKDKSRIGLLFCKEPLLKFYGSLGWKCVDHEHFHCTCMRNDNINIYNMVYNLNVIDCKLEYIGNLF